MSMIRFLAIVSLLLTIQMGCLANDFAYNNSKEEFVDTTEYYQYNVEIVVRERLITGICAMEVAPNGGIVGTMLNEFGVKALDFEYKDGRMKISNVFKPINKWYVRRIIRGDLQFIFDNFNIQGEKSMGKRHFKNMTDGSKRMTNDKYKISYTLSKIETIQ